MICIYSHGGLLYIARRELSFNMPGAGVMKTGGGGSYPVTDQIFMTSPS